MSYFKKVMVNGGTVAPSWKVVAYEIEGNYELDVKYFNLKIDAYKFALLQLGGGKRADVEEVLTYISVNWLTSGGNG